MRVTSIGNVKLFSSPELGVGTEVVLKLNFVAMKLKSIAMLLCC